MSAGPEGAGVQVFLRLRPTAEKSDIELFDLQPAARPEAITIKDPLSSGRCTHSFEFSGTLGPTDGQERVFSVVAAPAVEAALQGRSSCVLAYGQTGSGKTFSVFGEGGSKRGLLPRAMERLFQAGASRKAGGSAAGIAVSFLEVYLDQVYDLTVETAEGCGGEVVARRPSLPPQDGTGTGSVPTVRHTATFPLPKSQGSKPSATGSVSAASGSFSASSGRSAPSGAARGLEIHETANGRVFVQGLSRIPAYSMADVHRIMERGFAARKTAATAANQRSSRSHTVFTVYLQAQGSQPPGDSQELGSQGPLEDPGNEVNLSFVDLAGSERLAKTKAEGERFREAVAINTSLTALGKVVLALATGGGGHVPYRDSKITRILSGSLAGGAQISLLATVHPRVEDYEESLNTLSFAHKCTSITRPQVSFVTQRSAEGRLSELQAEAEELRALLARGGGRGQQTQSPPPWGAGLGSGPIAALPVESLNEAIDNIIAGATAGGRGLGGLTSLDPAVRCLAELREQRRCQAECQAKANRKMREMHAAKEEIGEQKACRVKEAEGLRHRRKALAAELECLKVELSAARAEQAAGHGAACRKAQLEADRRADEVNRALQEHNHTAVLCEDAVEGCSQRFEVERRQLGQRHVEVVRALKEQHSAQLEELEAQWQARLAGQDRRSRELALELPAARERERAASARCQAELLSLGDLVARLAGLVAEVEDGLHPIMRQGGVKGAILPDGAAPPRPTRDTHPVLFDATASAEERVAALERAGGRTLQPRTRLLSKAARGGLEGAEQLVADASRSRPASKTAALPGSETPGFGASLRSEATGVLAEAAAPAPADGAREDPRLEDARWDVAAFARDICEAEADTKAEELLAGLPREHLRRLCAELRARALEAFDPDAERQAIRRDLAGGLAGDATRQHLRQLERRRDEARAECNVAAERERRLRGELELRRAVLSGQIPPRPCSAASRAGSAGCTPGGHRSRSLSRRHFGPPAGGAGPPSAASTRAPSRATACPSLPSATSRRGCPGTAHTAGGTRPSTASAPCVAAAALKRDAATGVH